MIYYIDRKGKQTFEKNVFSRERLDIIDNPLFENIFKEKKNDQASFEKVFIKFYVFINWNVGKQINCIPFEFK